MIKKSKSELQVKQNDKPKQGNPVVTFMGRANVVQEAFESLNWVVAENQSETFNFCWAWPSDCDQIKRLQYGQIINQMPGQVVLTRKDNLAATIQEFQRTHPHFDLIPKTFILPINNMQLQMQMAQHLYNYYILKQAVIDRGEGITMYRGSQFAKMDIEQPAVVQEYLSKPLLINGFKFDFRIYVIVLQVDPLVLYYYDDGLARFATTPYARPTLKSVNDKTIHLTNYSQNKQNIKLDEIQNEEEEDQQTMKQANFQFKQKMSTVLKFLKEKYPNLREKVEYILKATIIAAEPNLSLQAMSTRTNSLPRKTFGFYGFDVIVLENGELKLLEVNANPSTDCGTDIDFELKRPLFNNMIQLTAPKKFYVKNKLVVQTLAPDGEIGKEKIQRKFSMKTKDLKDILENGVDKEQLKQTVQTIKKNLTEYEEKLYKQLQADNKNQGRFIKLIPSKNTDYIQYFDTAKYSDYFAALLATCDFI